MRNLYGHLPLSERLEAQCIPEPNTGCWLWLGSAQPQGYGRLWTDRVFRNEPAHRAAYRTWVGPIPDGLWVLHRCDVRPCINPAHLFLGTSQDNIDDKVRKGRTYGGERHNFAKLSAKQVVEVRRLFDSKHPTMSIARQYGLKRDAVLSIGHRTSWRSVPESAVAP